MINDLKQRAYEQERSENFGRAIELYESVIDHREAEGLTHQDASVFLRIADLHLRRDQEEDAIEAFQRAGELYAREGLQPQAIAVYRRILRIAPEHTEALWNLAWLHAEMGVMAEARDYVADYLRTVDMERDWVEARDFLRRLLDLSEDVAIGLRLAELLEEAGQHDAALDVLERLDVDFAVSSAVDQAEVTDRIEALRGEVVPEEERVDDGEVSFEGADAADADFEDSPPAEFGGFEEEPSEFGAASGEHRADDPAVGASGTEGDEEYDLEVDAGSSGSLDDGFPFPDADEELENGAADEGEFDEDPEAASGEEPARSEMGEDEGADDGLDRTWNEPESSFDEEPPTEPVAEDTPTDSFDALDDEVEGPASSWEEKMSDAEGDDREGAGEEEEAPVGDRTDGDSREGASDREGWETQHSDEHGDEREEDEEEQMSTHSEDLPGGTAVEKDREAGVSGPEDETPGAASGAPTSESRFGDDADTADYEEEYGEKAELRRGLKVLDELIELDPDRLEHFRRRVGYAERLDDPDVLVDSYVEMASALRRRDSNRGARLVLEHVLGLDVGAERAREGIDELDREAREALDVPELVPHMDAPAGPQGDRSELAERVWPELQRVRGRVQWLQGAAEMLRGEDGFGGRPPAEAYELAGRYYLAKGDVDGAIDVLSLALDRRDLDDADLVDVLFQLGLSHYRIDDRGSARRYFERVASHDEDFGTVYGWVLSER